MQGEHPFIAPGGGTPATDGFQLQLGPDGRCRLVLLGPDDAPVATLDLDAAQADRLAETLTGRRERYAQSRQDRRHRDP